LLTGSPGRSALPSAQENLEMYSIASAKVPRDRTHLQIIRLNSTSQAFLHRKRKHEEPGVSCRREPAITCRDSVGDPGSHEEVHHSRRMPQCYPGEQCASGRQKTHAGGSGRTCLPRDHNAAPRWERLRLLHRAVSHHRTAAYCSVGSFSGNSKPREPSLKSTHDPNF